MAQLRELLAGVALEEGEQAAELARCGIERKAALDFGHTEEKRADAAEARNVWVPIVSSVLTAVVTALTTWGVSQATQHHPALVGATGAP